jgi:formylglycine-generating enzyme required for sulfatase activity
MKIETFTAHLGNRWSTIAPGRPLCAPCYYLRLRPAARQPQLIATSMAHLGFRCVVRPNGQEL